MRRISVISRLARVVALAATTALAGSAAFAAASDYAFEPVNAEMKRAMTSPLPIPEPAK
jgi:hypothetical protein